MADPYSEFGPPLPTGKKGAADPYAEFGAPLPSSAPNVPSPIDQAISSVPKPPNPIMSAATEPSTFARWTGGDPESNEVFKREISAAGSSIVGIPSALYHAAADPATQEEKQNYGENFIRNIGPTGRLIERGIAQPVKNAADWYKQAFQGKVPDPVGQALSVAPEGVGTGAGQVALGGAIKAAPSVIKPVADYFAEKAPGRLVNQLIRPTKTNLSYSRNPGEAIANEGITAGSIEKLGDNVEQRISDLKNELHRQMGASANQPVDTSQSALSPIDREMNNAMTGPVANKPYLNALVELRDSITHELTPEGARGAPKNLVMTPMDALELKRAIGKATKWTPESAGYADSLTSLKREIYHNIDMQLDRTAPGTMELNDRMSNLISAKDAVDRVAPIVARHADAFHRVGMPAIFALEELARTGSLEHAGIGLGTGVVANLASDFVKGTRATTYGAQALRNVGRTAQAGANVVQAAVPAVQGTAVAGTVGEPGAKERSLGQQAADYVDAKNPNFFLKQRDKDGKVKNVMTRDQAALQARLAAKLRK